METQEPMSRKIGINRKTIFPQAVQKENPAFQEAESEKPKRIIRFLDGFITFGIMAIFFGLPVFFLGFTFQGLAFEKQLYFYFLIILSLIAWAVKGVILGEMKIKRTPLDIPIAIFWTAYVLSTIFSVDKWHSFWGFFGDPSRGLMSITAMILGYYLIASHFSEKRLQKIVGSFLVSGMIVFVWIILAIFDVQFLPEKFLPFAPLNLTGSFSGLGAFLAVVLPLAIMTVFKIGMSVELGKISKKTILLFLGALIVLDLFLIFALYNFISFPILLSGLVIFLIYILSMIVRPSGNLFWIPMATFVVILTVWMIGPVGNRMIKINLPVEVSPSYAMSWDVAKGSLQSGVAKFILGSGPATYGYDFSLFRPMDFNGNQLYNLRFYQGTGMFFEYLPTIGFLGTFAFAILFLSFVSFTIYFLSREKEKNKIYSLGILSASFIIILNAALGRADGTILILSAMFGALAVATVLYESETEKDYFSLSLKASPKFALTLAFVFMMVSAGAVFLFVYLGKVIAAECVMGSVSREKKVVEQSINPASRSLGLYGKEGRYYIQLGRMFMILANEEMLKGKENQSISKIQVYLNDSIEASRAGSELMKNDAMAVESLAFAYENAGLYVSNSLVLAEETYKRSQALEPLNPHFYLKMGQIKKAMALLEKESEVERKKQLLGEARDLFQKSVDLKKDFGLGYYNLALVKEALGDLDGAIENMRLAAESDRQEINYRFNLAILLQARGKDQDDQFAEALFKQVLGVNDKEINSHFYLALLYEKNEKRDEAIKEYQSVLELLPEDNQENRGKIEEMISNIRNGKSNIVSEKTSSEVETIQPDENQEIEAGEDADVNP